MTLMEIFRAVFINISTNKFRVFLTSLGIIVGSLTIILVVGIGKGSQAAVAEQFGRLNVTTIMVMGQKGQKGQRAQNATEVLDFTDVETIKSQAPSVNDVTIMINGYADVKYYNISESASVVGVMENYLNLNNLTLKEGQFLTDYDSERRNRVAVIGSDVADLLFGEEGDVVGSMISIKGRKFEVIGVLKYLGDSTPKFNLDEAILLPYEVAEKYVLGKNIKPLINAFAQDVDHVASAMDEITEVLKSNHKGKKDAFMVIDIGSRLEVAQESARTMSTLLIAIASIVLVVGGIGIMNVLLVSVKERTKEIGILKAIGARRRDILLQFLLESIIISVSGGLIGIFISFLVMPLMKYFDLRVIPSLYGNILALVFSIVTGTFFGYYPASKAAALKPIDALRYE